MRNAIVIIDPSPAIQLRRWTGFVCAVNRARKDDATLVWDVNTASNVHVERPRSFGRDARFGDIARHGAGGQQMSEALREVQT